MLNAFQRTVLELFLITSMTGIGLQVDWRDFTVTLQERRLLILSLLLNFVAIPILGWGVTQFVSMRPASAQALIILACAPGGISAVQFTSKSKAALAFAGQTAVLFAALSIFVSPFVMIALLPSNFHLIVPYGPAVAYMAVFLLAPLILGLFIRYKNGKLAGRLGPATALIGTVTFVFFILLTLSLRRAAMSGINHTELLALVCFILVTLLLGWICGGPRPETRPVMAAASSTRNVALAMAIVVRSAPGAGLDIPMAAFFALMVTPNMILVLALLVVNKFSSWKAGRLQKAI